MPDGLAVAGLFGGAIALLALALIGLNSGQSGALVVVGALVAFGAIVVAGFSLVRGLRRAAEALERRTREVEQAGSRLKVLVEHVPAAVYIDVADPDVTDGGHLAYMSPQVTGDPRLPTRGAR